jgi:Cu2+-exporting ATPase
VRSERLVVARIGADRLRIKGALGDSPLQKQLYGWLVSRTEVRKVDRRRTGALDVTLARPHLECDELLRNLDELLFTVQRSAGGRRSLEVIHEIPGRVRLAMTGATAEEITRLAAWIATRPGVLRATASPVSLSIVVVFDESLTTGLLTTSIRASDPSEWPKVEILPPAPRHTLRTAALSSVVLGAAVSGAVPVPAMGVVVAFTAIPPARRAIRALGQKRLSVDLLDLAAVGISIGTGQPATGAFITWLLSIGDHLLAKTADKARAAISQLVDLDAPDAFRLNGDRVEHVPADKLKEGDRIVVAAGRRVPADGVVVSGVAAVDEKALTGESLPRTCEPGARVLSATVVLDGELVIEVERVGRDTVAAKIVKMLEGAGAKPMTLQKNAERVADRLVAPTFGVAGAAMALTGEIARATSVLITDFGTGLRIVLPTSALAAMAIAAREGVLVKGAQYLERLAAADVIVFDKTGTLTEGAPEVTGVVATGEIGAAEVLALTAAVEAQASHPIAEALRRHAATLALDVPYAELGGSYVAGRGIIGRVHGRQIAVGSARMMAERGVSGLAAGAEVRERHRREGISSIYVAVDGALAGVIGYADRPRPETVQVLRELRARKRRVVLLSGDAREQVEAVARAVGVDEAMYEMLPEDKARYVRALQAEGRTVAMVGDGINDAPALSIADVGVSLHGGTEVALETADVVLRSGLGALVTAIDTSERAMKHVKRGLALVIVPNAVAIVAGAVGVLAPPLAAVINNGTTVLGALAALAPVLRSPKKKKA